MVNDQHTKKILRLCDESRKEIVIVDESTYLKEIELIKNRAFSGVIKLASEEKGVLGIMFLDTGEVKFISAGNPKDAWKVSFKGEGLLEVYRFTSDDVAKVYEIIGVEDEREGGRGGAGEEAGPHFKITKEAKPRPYSVAEIKKMVEAYKLIRDYGTRKVNKKKVKPLSPKELEKIFEGRITLDEESNIICRKVLGKMKEDIAELFGKHQEESLLKKQFKRLDIDERNITCRDVGMIIEDLRREILEKIYGKEKADLITRRFREYFITFATHTLEQDEELA